jgi:hypothetical protein
MPLSHLLHKPPILHDESTLITTVKAPPDGRTIKDKTIDV